MIKKSWQNYFGKNEKIYVFKCTRCKYEDPVPSWLLEECGGFTPLKKIPKKDFKMTCPRCGRDTMEYKVENKKVEL